MKEPCAAPTAPQSCSASTAGCSEKPPKLQEKPASPKPQHPATLFGDALQITRSRNAESSRNQSKNLYYFKLFFQLS